MADDNGMSDEDQQRVVDFAFREPEKFDVLMDVVRVSRKSKSQLRQEPEFLARLLELKRSFEQRYEFQQGDAIHWKLGMKNKLRPGYGEPVVVLELLDQPIISPSDNAGSAYFREQLDLVIGLLDDDEEFRVFHVDSRRFRPVDPNDYSSTALGAGLTGSDSGEV